MTSRVRAKSGSRCAAGKASAPGAAALRGDAAGLALRGDAAGLALRGLLEHPANMSKVAAATWPTVRRAKGERVKEVKGVSSSCIAGEL